MSTIDFPASPTTGQQYTFAEKTWQFNGYGWQQIGNGGQVSVSWTPITFINDMQVWDGDLTDAMYQWYELNYV